ncbi:hypothetical protein TPE_1398 [Treponema pedis str. T A4]|uniref:Uncharacterized protein n=1 Tax=Treponema pedis str. T A4 TaxID=1291379 RepID=S5ZZV4_9SPIR|nr:hypothetical protein TPE_1398 [Treponema pedis str. T A4]
MTSLLSKEPLRGSAPKYPAYGWGLWRGRGKGASLFAAGDYDLGLQFN